MNNKKLVTTLIITNLLIIAAVIFLVGSEAARARGLLAQTTPHLISYQGMLTDDNSNPISGTKTLTMSVFNTDTGDTPLWQETHSNVQVSDGAFSVLLGSNTVISDTLFDEPDRWLEINIEGDTLSPRQQFASVPYALNADKVDGMDASELGAFPSPAYDSGWIILSDVLTLTHNLGGDIDDYVVDMTFRGSEYGYNVAGFGGITEVYWFDLTAASIAVSDPMSAFHGADEVRVRIWVYE